MVITDMGSDHYCLRWNNHQNNLLGVFSQLLQEESLVDVTLACSEGHSIRAHKVVLSACSTYFQSLFKDHPSRHPIVILKDVCFSELRTLVEFMYRGEVNVEYCQLSALLKTAQSLKVKGLSEMTHLRTSHSPEITDQAPTAAPETTSVISEPHSVISENPIALVHPSRSPDYERRNNIPASPSPVVVSPARSEYPCRMSPVDGSVSPIIVDDDRIRPSYIQSHTTTPHYRTPPNPSPNLLPVQEEPLSLKIKPDWDRASNSNSDQASSISRECISLDTEREREVGAEKPDIYSCLYCGVNFAHQSKLTRHILSHSLDTLRYRDLPSQFPYPQTHSQIVPIAATVTDSISTVTDNVFRSPVTESAPTDSSVVAVDTGELPATVCKYCSKAFPDIATLLIHLPVHTGDRPFKCEFCGKAFKLRHHMKDHCRVHTGERPFRCAICGKTFSRSTILKAHEKTHYPKYVRRFLSSPSPEEERRPPDITLPFDLSIPDNNNTDNNHSTSSNTTVYYEPPSSSPTPSP